MNPESKTHRATGTKIVAENKVGSLNKLEYVENPKKKDLGSIMELRVGEDYGIELQQIKKANSHDYYFEDERDHDFRHMSYSTHESVVEGSKWVNFHKAIRGEFFDLEFSAQKRETLFGLERCEDDYDTRKL